MKNKILLIATVVSMFASVSVYASNDNSKMMSEKFEMKNKNAAILADSMMNEENNDKLKLHMKKHMESMKGMMKMMGDMKMSNKNPKNMVMNGKDDMNMKEMMEGTQMMDMRMNKMHEMMKQMLTHMEQMDKMNMKQ